MAKRPSRRQRMKNDPMNMSRRQRRRILNQPVLTHDYGIAPPKSVVEAAKRMGVELPGLDD